MFTVFPPLWLFSLVILLSPLSAPEDWEQTKSEEERAALLTHLRKVEVRWARRSVIAGTVLLSLVVLVAITVVVVRHV